MKPEWITDNLIDLARKLYNAGYWKEITKGTWYIHPSGEIELWPYIDSPEDINVIDHEDLIPIPTLTDCLSWLDIKTNNRGMWLVIEDEKYLLRRWSGYYWDDLAEAPTPTEAAYLAMIKILEASDDNRT